MELIKSIIIRRSSTAMFGRCRKTTIPIVFGVFLTVFIYCYLGSNGKDFENSNIINKVSSWIGVKLDSFNDTSISSVFFVETSGKPNIELREACAVESAALHHPKQNVTLFHVAPFSPEDLYIRTLDDIPNVKISYLNLSELFENTPMEMWNRLGVVRLSQYPVEHLSDAIRLAVLWKYGGIYFDTDVITIRPLYGIHNALGLQNSEEANGAVLVFDQGNSFLYECMEGYVMNFSSSEWGKQGPQLVSRILRKTCDVEYLTDIICDPKSCRGVTLLPETSFYPIPWPEWSKLFLLKNEVNVDLSRTFTVHLWGKLSRSRVGTPGDNSLLDILAQKNCPSVYKWMISQKQL